MFTVEVFSCDPSSCNGLAWRLCSHWPSSSARPMVSLRFLRLLVFALQAPAAPREYAARSSHLPPGLAADVAFAGLSLDVLEAGPAVRPQALALLCLASSAVATATAKIYREPHPNSATPPAGLLHLVCPACRQAAVPRPCRRHWQRCRRRHPLTATAAQRSCRWRRRLLPGCARLRRVRVLPRCLYHLPDACALSCKSSTHL